MPNLKLEYTANVLEQDNFSLLFAKIHQILTEKLPTHLINCKSRAVLQSDYYIGDGDLDHAFVCVQLQVMAGRSPQRLNEVSELILKALSGHFAASLQQRMLQITLEVQELSHDKYFKIISG